jgi:uncharacterized protein YecE (DUF72 family)
MPRLNPDVRIGISGWTYTPWRGTFYPEGLAHRLELTYAATRLNSIEINGSFYSLQRPSSYRDWYDATPAGFRFSLKGGRYITHMRRLRDVEEPLANFFASGLLELRDKLGPILWQFPPNFIFNAEKLEAFFKLLPRDTMAASKMAKRHTSFMKGRTSTRTDADRELRYAIEIRHESFRVPEFIDMLRKHQIALCVADTAGNWPYLEDMTADFVYVRLHGEQELYASGYTDEALDRWAARMKLWTAGSAPTDGPLASPKPARKHKQRDLYVYFDNDIKVHAPFDALHLAERLGISWAKDHEAELPAAKPRAKAKKPSKAKQRRSPWEFTSSASKK